MPKVAACGELAPANTRPISPRHYKAAKDKEERHTDVAAKVEGRRNVGRDAMTKVDKRNKQKSRPLQSANSVCIILL